MMNDKRTMHTPGPWYADDHRGDIEIVGRPEWPCRRHNTKGEWTVAKLDDLDFGHDDEVRANARLVAAAPAMLEALHKAREWLEGWGSAEHQLDVINAAIASAEVQS